MNQTIAETSPIPAIPEHRREPAGAAFPAATATTAATASAEPAYKLVIDETVVEKVSAKATQKIDGVVDMKGNLFSTIQENLGGSDQTKGVSADVVDNTNASVELNVILEYGKSAPEVFEQIKRVVSDDLTRMTGLNITEMTVNVVDVMTKEEFAEKNGTAHRDSAGEEMHVD